jgi:hypothetical protein
MKRESSAECLISFLLSSAINNAMNGTSNYTNGICTLDTAFADPPTLADLEALRQKMNEMILNGLT